MLPDDDVADTPPRDRDPAKILERFRADFEFLRRVAEQMHQHRDRVRRRYQQGMPPMPPPAAELVESNGQVRVYGRGGRGGTTHKLCDAEVERIREIARNNPGMSVAALSRIAGHDPKTIKSYINDFP